MKKKMYLIALCMFGIMNLYSQTFNITHSQIKVMSNGEKHSQDKIAESCQIFFNKSSENVEIYSDSGVRKYGPVRLYSENYEQGLYIENYVLLEPDYNQDIQMYKFTYDSKGGKPVSVVEISTKSSIVAKFYYTEYFFELNAKR